MGREVIMHGRKKVAGEEVKEGKEKEEKMCVEGLMGGGRNKRSRREGGARRRV